MAKTLQERATEIAEKHGIAPEAVTVTKGTRHSLIGVDLPNGRKIRTDSIKGWEQSLDAHIKRFAKK